MKKSSPIKISPDIKILLFYLGLALITTFPLALHFKSFALGDLKSDMWKHIWGFWWIKNSLFTDFCFPLQTDLLNFPRGGSIFFIDSLGALLSIPLQLLWGLIPAYNLMVILNLTLAGFFAYELCFYLSKNRWAAVTGGVVYAFSAYFYSNLISGITEALNIPWIPLFLMYFLKSLREKGWKNPLFCGFSFFLAAFGSLYHGLFCALMAGLLLISNLLTGAKKNLARGKLNLQQPAKILLHLLVIGLLFLFIGHWRFFLLGCLLYLLILIITEPAWFQNPLKQHWSERVFFIGLVAAVLLTPPLYFFHKTLSQPDALVVRKRIPESFEFYLGDSKNSCRLVDYFLPGKTRAKVSLTVDRLTKIAYPGYLVLILAVLGWLKTRRRYQLTFTFSALWFFFLSLGPYLKWPDAQSHELKNYLYLACYKFLPFFSQAAIPYRFSLMVFLSLSVLTSYSLAGIFRRNEQEWQKKLALILSLGVILESVILSPVPFPLPESRLVNPPFYQKLGQESQFYGILDLPIQRGEKLLLPGEYFYYQIFHQKGIPYNVEGTIPTPVYENLFTLYLFNLEKKFDLKIEKTAYAPPKKELDLSFKEFKKQGYHYLVLHVNYYPAEVLPAARAYLRHYCGKPKLFPPDLEVYRID